MNDLASEVSKMRERRGLSGSSKETLRRQIVAYEKTGRAGPLWRSLLADALRKPEDELFTLALDEQLPAVAIQDIAVTSDFVKIMLEQREAHIRIEHMFGPGYAKELVGRDLATVQNLLPKTPSKLRRNMHLVMGLICELGGWIAQDSGNMDAAEQLTARADDYLRCASPQARAMALMRRANIIMVRDPALSMDLATTAGALLDGVPSGRLAVAVARQQALTAAATKDRAAFLRHWEHAMDIADVEPVEDDLAIYATKSYVVAELAVGLMRAGGQQQAVELLNAHIGNWPSEQQCDRAVAALRLVYVFVRIGDYDNALAGMDDAVRFYRAAPSQRARRELRAIGAMVRDRGRMNRTRLLQALRVRAAEALQGDAVYV